MTLIPLDGTEQELPCNVPYFKVNAGDKLESRGPCGGGYGDAALRPSEAISADVANGLISAGVARGLFAQGEK